MLTPDQLAAANAPLADDHRADFDALGARLARRGLDADALADRIASFDGRRALVGARHRRHPLWSLSRPRRAARRVREAGGRGGRPPPHRRHADRLAAHPVGRARRPGGAARPRRRPRPRLRRRQLEYLSGPGRRRRTRTSSARSPTPTRPSGGRPSSTTCTWSRSARRSARRPSRSGSPTAPNYPGQANLRKSFDRVQACLEEVYAALPEDWRLFTEHKPYEPAFYSTVVQDWGSSYLLAQALGPEASCLVDLGHHLPNTNIELVVARLIGAGKLAGFHFNDSAYGDDDLETGSIRPYRLFLVFNELVDAAEAKRARLRSGLHDRPEPQPQGPHRGARADAWTPLQTAYAQALIVDRAALAGFQDTADVLLAERQLQLAFRTDVAPARGRGPPPPGRRPRPHRRLPRLGLPGEGGRRPHRRRRLRPPPIAVSGPHPTPPLGEVAHSAGGGCAPIGNNAPPPPFGHLPGGGVGEAESCPATLPSTSAPRPGGPCAARWRTA